MARDKHPAPGQEPQDDSTPVYGDYSFDDSLDAITADLPQEKPPEAPVDDEEENHSDTPEEALAKFYASRGYTPGKTEGGEAPRPRSLPKREEKKDESAGKSDKKQKRAQRKKEKKARMARGEGGKHNLRIILLTLITALFVGLLLLIGLSYFVDTSLLDVPAAVLSRVVAPVQNGFSGVTESLAGYFRRLKLRATLEEAYEELRAENERLVYQAMMADELQIQLSQYEDIYDEITANRNMEPITATVVARYDGNYFSTFTINKGSRDGIEPYMAVTISGALIGYTEDVSESTSTVRTIIDSEASIAGLIQSSRDQGTIRGTLGIDGTPMCRMYYLPDDHLPRPGDIVVTSGVGMSFPKGIPIGTVRESTRGMDANKQYIVVEPQADFEHIEYVIVYRYKPQAEAVQGRDNASAAAEFVPLETARPYPTLRLGSSSYFLPTATPEVSATPTPKPTPTPTPSPTRTPVPTPSPTPSGPVYEYQVIATGPTATPTASPTPSPTPFITYGPDDLTWEDE